MSTEYGVKNSSELKTIPHIKKQIMRYLVGIVAIVVCISVWSMYVQYDNAITSAERQAAGYVRALAEHSESAFAEADRILRDTVHELEREGGAEQFERHALYDLLLKQSEGAPQVGALFVVDNAGNMLVNTNQFPQKPINVADRDYFKHYLNTPGAGLTIGQPVISRLVNRWRFNLMRPLHQTDSGFSGIIAAAFEVSYFKDFLGATSLGPRGRIVLVRDDGMPLVFEPGTDKSYESSLSSTLLFTTKLPAAPSGYYQIAHSTVDNEPRIISYQRLKRFPVIAVVALHKGDVLAPLMSKALFQSIMTIGLCLVIIILSKILFRQMDSLHGSRTEINEQERKLQIKAAQIDAASDAILQLDEHGSLLQFNQALCAMTGYSSEELSGIRLHDIEPPEFSDNISSNIQLLQRNGQMTFESAFICKDGTTLPIEGHARIMISDDQPYILSIVRDISQRKKDAVRDETRLRILERMATGSLLPELLEMIVRFVEQENPGSLCSVLLANENGTHLKHGAAPSLPDQYNAAVNGLRIAQGMGSCGTAAFLKTRVIVEEIDGHPFWKGFKPAQEAGLHACWSEPVLSSNGTILGTFAMYYREPRTPQHEEILFIEAAANLASIAIGKVREEELRQKLEEQLLHIQKIEAIGQLAGGIAHDFNNLLTPILVYAEMAKKGLPAEDPLNRRIDGIISAANKAKDLTQKLLSFGRKQMLNMEIIDLNEVIESFQDILRRTIRENISIDVKLAPGGVILKADRSQLEQVLLNLTVNAQDAISGVGTISVNTGHVLLDDEYARQHHGMLPGSYILLGFMDTGCGMDDNTLHHIYEPFFTTKPVGHGTGLGLATVYGIVKQHEGYIEARSHVGKGTTFLIYLPTTTEGLIQSGMKSISVENDTDHAVSTTILLTEDNIMVREMAVDLLESAGFNVLAAASPQDAQAIEHSFGGNIDLLLTDVIMPDMNGMELFEILRHRRPAMAVLYISGYTSDMVIHDGTLEESVNFLKKPFTAEQLIERVTQVVGLHA
ncbi:MAG: PAS domain S-box protein [Desulfuromonadaceae bacterium]|nr:PAS domain S-box protein [Desulfuromonadaceae bacterium]MDD5105826.1 PAS domain S-box protein [Desulfuromonadaceae bacterium]